MSDSTLDDLILTDPEPEGGKSKGILLLLSLVVVLLIVGAVLAKMIFSSPDDVNAKDGNATTEVKKDISINSPINATTDNNAKAQDNNAGSLDADLSPLDDGAVPANVETVTIEDKPKQDSQKSSKNSDAMSIDKIDSNSNTKKAEPELKQKVKKVEHKVKPKVEHKPKPKPTTHTYGGHGNTYIQVGSFSKGPNEKFINKIIKSGFRYRIKEVNGFRRVYVGPFTNSEASRVLGRVKAKISPSAFIKK